MRTVHARVALLLNEVIAERDQPLSMVPVDGNTLRRITSGEKDYMFSTLVEVAGALGYDVVVNLRVQS
jgi:hypothetical protein